MQHRSFAILLSAAYSGLLLWCYATRISPRFSYFGYTYHRPPPGPYIVALVYIVATAAVMPLRPRRPSQIAQWMLYLLVVIPTLLIPDLTLNASDLKMIGYSTSIFISFMLLSVLLMIPTAKITLPLVPPPLFWTAMCLLSIVLYGYILTHYGLHFRLVALSSVYDVRSDYKNSLDQSGSLIAYAVSWQSAILNPLFMAAGLAYRRWWAFAAGAAGQVLVYSISAQKSVLLSTILLLALALLSRPHRKVPAGPALLPAFTLLVLGSTIVDYLLHGFMLSSLFVRRLILTSGVNTANYFDFFSNHPKALLGQSIVFRTFSHYPYSQAPANVVGAYFYNNSGIAANANYLADAYANFGVLGMLAFTGVLAGFLWLFDSVVAQRDSRICLMLLGLPALALSNTALFTTFMTHGLLLALVIVALMPPSLSEAAHMNSAVRALTVAPRRYRSLS